MAKGALISDPRSSTLRHPDFSTRHGEYGNFQGIQRGHCVAGRNRNSLISVPIALRGFACLCSSSVDVLASVVPDAHISIVLGSFAPESQKPPDQMSTTSNPEKRPANYRDPKPLNSKFLESKNIRTLKHCNFRVLMVFFEFLSRSLGSGPRD